MKVLCFFSGGKDSTLAAFFTLQSGFEVELVTFFPENKESYMLHSTCLEITRYQAKAMGLKHHTFYVSGEKEREVEEMLSHLSKLKSKINFSALCSGALASEYQKQRIDYMANELSIPSFSPLWHKGKALEEDYKHLNIIISKVSSANFGEELLGKQAQQFFDSLYFEGGEAETLVLDAPFFSFSLKLEFEKKWYKDWGEIKVNKVMLLKKS